MNKRRTFMIGDQLYSQFRVICLHKEVSASKIIREQIQNYVDEQSHFEDVKDEVEDNLDSF